MTNSGGRMDQTGGAGGGDGQRRMNGRGRNGCGRNGNGMEWVRAEQRVPAEQMPAE